MAYNPTSKEFKQLSKEYNLIPIYKEIRADLDTPLSIYLKLAKNSYSFLLESITDPPHKTLSIAITPPFRTSCKHFS